MLQRKVLGAVALLALLAGPAANADEPQIRLGIDILWGGYGPVYVAPPPVVYHPPRYAYGRGYDRGHERGYNRAKWRGNGHRKHRHHRGDDCDD